MGCSVSANADPKMRAKSNQILPVISPSRKQKFQFAGKLEDRKVKNPFVTSKNTTYDPNDKNYGSYRNESGLEQLNEFKSPMNQETQTLDMSQREVSPDKMNESQSKRSKLPALELRGQALNSPKTGSSKIREGGFELLGSDRHIKADENDALPPIQQNRRQGDQQDASNDQQSQNTKVETPKNEGSHMVLTIL